MEVLYTAQARATGDGRNGRAQSSDGQLEVTLAAPVELGGDGNGTNPEQLFAAGYAACFHSALRLAARRHKADVSGSTVNASVDFGTVGGGAYGIGVRMEIGLPQLKRTAAQELAEAAHQICPYSNATRGNISVELSILELTDTTTAPSVGS